METTQTKAETNLEFSELERARVRCKQNPLVGARGIPPYFSEEKKPLAGGPGRPRKPVEQSQSDDPSSTLVRVYEHCTDRASMTGGSRMIGAAGAHCGTRA